MRDALMPFFHFEPWEPIQYFIEIVHGSAHVCIIAHPQNT